jgi:hypothetical protein
MFMLAPRLWVRQLQYRRCPDQGESLKGELDRAGARPLADHEIELIILHRRIEDFLDRRIETMNFVDEEHVAFLEPGKLRRAMIASENGGMSRGRFTPVVALGITVSPKIGTES